MSGSSPPSSPPLSNDPGFEGPSTPVASNAVTRTVAIIKTHALTHRFDIEPRILEASFEIVKERQIEFDTDSDPDFLYELFGEDADSLTEGPVWVYVLERRRAVEVWNTLMGDADPLVAHDNSPNSLRALYGISRRENAVMGSADARIAELQIASLFASSPPFPAAELPDVGLHGDSYGTVRSTSSSVRKGNLSEDSYTRSNPSSSGRPKLNGKVLFRARPLPKTHDVPDIQPRTTRAAALRAGIAVEKTPIAPRAPLSKARIAMTFANVPGHKRSGTITVASTAPPVVAPRMTRAASLRIGQPAPPVTKRRPSSAIVAKARAPDPATFEGVPGHKRRETISVASVKAPTVTPRLNKSAALRAAKDSAPPTSYMFRTSTTPKAPGISRTNSYTSMDVHLRPASQTALERPRPASAILTRPDPHQASTSADRGTQTPTPTNGSPAVVEAESPPPPPAKVRPRPSSMMAPRIAPRTNRSALLRAAKMEAAATPGKASKSSSSTRAVVH